MQRKAEVVSAPLNFGFINAQLDIILSSCACSEDDLAMVFMSSELGEHSITTRDIDVNENTVIQFEVGTKYIFPSF